MSISAPNLFVLNPMTADNPVTLELKMTSCQQRGKTNCHVRHHMSEPFLTPSLFFIIGV